jgi:hypothetical protein
VPYTHHTNRAVKVVGRVLLRDLDLLVFLGIAVGWERMTGAPLTLRAAGILVGGYVILRLLYRLGISLKAYRDSLVEIAASEKEKRLRVFVEDPEVVLELAKLTGYEALRRFTPYLGKWMMISGRFDGATESLQGDAIHLSLILNDGRRINLRFAMDCREQLIRLREGQRITAIGEIEYIAFTFSPQNCELVRVEPIHHAERYALARVS